ncbi:MAG: EthD domain-containing protein [Proteobacteria bacterium]|nr:EthD domain-containing protein [Pseudomonadota bacterium]
MIVVLGFYNRKPGMTYESFSDYWKNVHGPMISGNAEVRKYMKRYIQHHLRPNEASHVKALGYDGFSESWYETEEDRAKLLALPVFQNDIVPDEDVFLDMSTKRTSMFDTQVVQIGRPGTE